MPLLPRRIALSLIFTSYFAIAAVPQALLRIETPAQNQRISLEDLQKRLKPATLTVYNPAYKREMTYQGFWLEEVLNEVHFPQGFDIIFSCQDGYTAMLPSGSLGKHRWLLAYGETSGGWTPLVHGAEKVSPAPWYVIGANKESFSSFSWPYQVVALKSVKSW